MPKRPCLDCGKLTINRSRCDAHRAAHQAAIDAARGSSTKRGYGSAYRRTAKALVAKHRATYGDWCPGWLVPSHYSADLTVDHIIPVSKGGTHSATNLQVICRPCNSRKRNNA